MSSKAQDGTPQQTSVTPRRLRSGTHYGNHKCEPANNARKEVKKATKECQAHDPDTSCRDRPRPRDNDCLIDPKTASRPAEDRFVIVTPTSVSSSPNDVHKGQNLKAILESIQPNLYSKGKPSSNSKRKTLRDLLDQKMYKEKQDPDLPIRQEMETASFKLEKCVAIANKENNHHVKSVQDKEVSTDDTQGIITKHGVSPAQSTAHTQTRLEVGDFGKIKQDPPDDFWAMKMNYVEKRSVRNNSVELRIKAEGHSGQQDDRSQTFRISCSRPDTANNTSALHRNMKPDIVLKVRPRSSSMPSTINRSTPQDISNHPVNTYKTVSRFHGRLEPQTTIFSAINPLSLKSRSCMPTREEESKILYARSIKPPPQPQHVLQHHRYHNHCTASSLQAVGIILQGDNHVIPKAQGHVMPSTNSMTFDMLGHGDVLEESKLPPVANTVELLSEPHEYKDSGVDTTCIYKISDYMLSANSCTTTTATATTTAVQQMVEYSSHHQLQPQPASPQPPVLEPMQPLMKPESRYDEPDSTTADWTLETSLCLKREDPMLWRDFDLDQDHMHRMRHHDRDYNNDDDDVGGMLGSCSLPNLIKEEYEDDDAGRLEDLGRALQTAACSRGGGFRMGGRERHEPSTPPGRCGSASAMYHQSSRMVTPQALSEASTPLLLSNASTPPSSCSSTNFPISCKDKAGSRRRRKGRPNKRAERADRRWQNTDMCLSPQDDDDKGEDRDDEEDDDDDDERGNGRAKGRGSLRRSSSASSSSSGYQGRQGKGGKRAGTTGGGYDGGGGGRGRGGRKSMDPETLWANPELDTHGFLLWASENRGEVEKRNKERSAAEVEGLLSSQWRQMAFSGKLQYLCRARDASTDHNKHTLRKKKVPKAKKDHHNNHHNNHHNHHQNNNHNHHHHNHQNNNHYHQNHQGYHHHSKHEQDQSLDNGRCVYEQFLRLPQERQKDLLRKWLRFFQKMLPRLEYQEFISDFKKACKALQLRPVPARRKNARLRNLDPSHYHMLFEKIRETRPRVISMYNKRKVQEEELLRQSFSVMVRRLISGQHWPFVRGCRSKFLGDLMKDIQQLEVEEVLAQIDLPMPLTSGELGDPFLVKDVQDAMVAVDVGGNDSSLTVPDQVLNQNTSSVLKEVLHGHEVTRKPSATATNIQGGSPSSTILSSNIVLNGTSNNMTSMSGCCGSGSSSVGGCCVEADLPESPYVHGVLESLRHSLDLPILDQRCLDSIFLGPPSRSSSSSSMSAPSSSSASSSSSSSSAPTPTTTASSSLSSSSSSSSSCPASTSSRGQTVRETQFQNSATYRRTLLYKHIQPLLDTRGMPLTSSALYHTHSAQFFFPDDR